MEKLLLFLLLLIIASCSKPDLRGHWHVEPIDGEALLGGVDYFTIDIENDTFGLFNKYVFSSEGWGGYIDRQNQEFRFGGECLVINFRYKFEGEKLILNQTEYDKEYEKKFIGFKCDGICCDKQKEYFALSDLEINLPLAKDTSLLVNRPNQFSLVTPLWFGKPKEYYQDIYGQDHVFTIRSLGALLLNKEEDIELAEEKFAIKVPENQRPRISRTIYADQNTPLKIIIPVLEKYQSLNKKRIYIAFREASTYPKLNLWYKRVDFNQIQKMKQHQELTWSEWLELD